MDRRVALRKAIDHFGISKTADLVEKSPEAVLAFCAGVRQLNSTVEWIERRVDALIVANILEAS